MSSVLNCTGHQLKLPNIVDSEGAYLIDGNSKRYLQHRDLSEQVEELIDYLGLVISIQNKFEIELPEAPTLTERGQENLTLLTSYLLKELPDVISGKMATRLLEQSIQKHNNKLKTGFYFEFTDNEVGRINEIIGELRNIISNSSLFDDGHRQRLLKRLEKLQAEIHKKVSDLDRFWGMVGDAGVALGKFGDDAKPIVDRIGELADIVWRAQSKAEGLPTKDPMPLLSHNNGEE